MLRALSSSERFMCKIGQEDPIFFTMTARIVGDLSLPELESALIKVRQKHPLTAVKVMDDAHGQPYFAATDVTNIPLRIIENEADNYWQSVIAEELTVLIDPQHDPLIRFVWLKGNGYSDLIAVFHHAIADGLSAAYLMRDILIFLGDPEAEVASIPLTPPLEELIPVDVEAELLPQIMANLEKELAQELPETIPERALPPPSQFTVHARELTQVQTTALVKRVRAEQTTVHGALGAAFLFAFAEQFGANSSYTRTIQSPLNMRPHLAQPVAESLGSFIHLLMTEANCAPDQELWQVARTIRNGFVQQLTPATLFSFPLMIKQMGIIDSATFDAIYYGWISTREKHVDYDLSLSNIGRLDFPAQYGRFQLRSLYGPTFSATLDENVVGVCTVNGRLSFTFIHKPEFMDTAVAETIITHTLQILQNAVSW